MLGKSVTLHETEVEIKSERGGQRPSDIFFLNQAERVKLKEKMLHYIQRGTYR
jgi:hypothetical protein